jgi:hypothetical protein
VLAGAAMTAAWLLLVGLFATSAATYFWLTMSAVAVASAVAAMLMRFGDRGVATGVALTTSIGASVAVVLVVTRWVSVGWPLW